MTSRTIRRLTARLSSFIIICLILIAALILPVSAAQKGFVLDSERDIEISILYEGSEPSVTVTAPDKKAYTTDSQYDKVERDTGILNLYIKGAAPGRWDVKTSGDAEITILSWNEPLNVSSFRIGSVKEDRVEVTAVVSHPENIRYSWRIYAIPDFTTTGLMSGHQIMLRDTSGTANSEAKTDLDLRRLPDGDWTLAMEAIYTYPDGIEVEGTAQADKAITIAGHTEKGSDSDFITVTDLTERTVQVDWSAIREAGYYDEMLLSVVGSTDEPVFYSTFDRDTVTARIVDDDNDAHELTIRLMPLDDGVYTAVYTRTVSFEPSFSLSIDTPEATGDMMAKISYNIGSEEKPLDVSINGSTTRYRIKGNSSISVALDSMVNNEVVARCYLTDTDAYQVTKTVTVRSDPPVLMLYGISDKTVTNDKAFSISGKTDPDAKLTLNGSPVEVEADGSFTAETTLQLGDNSLVFTAENAYGIRTTRTVSVNLTEGDIIDLQATNKNKLGWIPIAAGGALALISAAVLILVILLSRKRGKKKSVIIVRAIAAVLGLVALTCGVFAAYCFFMKGTVNDSVTGDQLVGLLKAEDYQGIADKLDQIDVWQSRSVTLIIVASVALVLMTVVLVLLHVISKKMKIRPERPKKVKAPGAQRIPYPDQPPTMSGTPYRSPGNDPAYADPGQAASAGAEPSAPDRFCPQCGAPQSEDTTFCGICGYKLK